MRLDINLASQPYQNMRTFWMRWITGLAALFVIMLFAFLHRQQTD